MRDRIRPLDGRVAEIADAFEEEEEEEETEDGNEEEKQHANTYIHLRFQVVPTS